MRAALEIALTYIAREWSPIPVPYKGKDPGTKGWQQLRITAEDAPRYFNGAPQNVGVLLGAASAGLADVDLDSAEAVAVAPYLLPRTNAVFGRKSNRDSHYLYATDVAERHDKATLEYRDPTLGADAKPLLELRIGGGGKGAQTVFPGSVHESGEPIEWEQRGEPLKISGDELEAAVRKAAAAALLARHWPGPGARHKAALAVGGMLAHGGWTVSQAALLVQAVARAAGDPEWADRVQAAKDSVNTHEKGGKVQGLPTLIELMDERAVKRAAEWLGLVETDVFGHTKRASTAHSPRASKAGSNDIVTEDSAALRFAEAHKDRLRYCHDTGAWFEWTGATWRINKTGIAFRWSRELARELAQTEPDRIRYVTSKTGFAGGVERFARFDAAFAVTIDTWDQDPWLLGTPGGTVDLRTGILRPSIPTDYITRSTSVAPAAEADCPRWRDFLVEATGGDAPLIRFLQQWCGYCLTGITREHALVFVYGPGGNGKGTFVNALTGIMQDYATAAAIETFTASKYDRHPTEIAALRGARAVTASETENGRAWAESRIKQLTGGDKMRARFMRQDEFEFMPTLKLLVIGNHKPVLHSVDDAMRRRFNIVPFTRKPAIPDQQLDEKLKAEWPAILRWMIDGGLDWQQHRLVRPSSVREATSEYFGEQDLIAQWLEERCDAEPGKGNSHKSAKTGELYESWAAFAKDSGEGAGSKKSFSSELQKRGFEPDKGTGGVRIFRSIRLKPKDPKDFNKD